MRQVVPAQSKPDYYIGLRGRPGVEAIVGGLPIWVQASFPDARYLQ